MDLVRKWWWLILVGVVIGLGIIFFRNGLVNKDKGVTTDKTSVSDQKAQVVVDKKLVNLEKQVRGEVVNWDGKKSELTFKIIDSQEIIKIIVDSDKMGIFIPKAQSRTEAVLPLYKGSVHWETARYSICVSLISPSSGLRPHLPFLPLWGLGVLPRRRSTKQHSSASTLLTL